LHDKIQCDILAAVNDQPIAYHLTFGTYGTRLHGNDRGTVHRLMNHPGDPIVDRAEAWQRMERSLLKYPMVILTEQQRLMIEETIPSICERGGWKFLHCAARADHVHVQLKGNTEGKAIRRWLKTWLGQALNVRWPKPVGASWWAECGSVKWIWTDDYFENVYLYIDDQRTTPGPR